MTRLPRITGQQVIAALRKAGFQVIRIKGSHHIGEDEDHPLASFMEILGILIEKYEDEHVPELTAI